ncbi:MAG: PilZ domain-containing protein [Spirochaetales bacterium]|uniref:PilZ domain-containing protein n=1 Tax=Candidatus Thalassospirochaeta sargassi TaxID=3119039 RepID=A0AAJ1MNA0_9SPIO|nr:PilZ domain-containing protein [Spirochaetales bacterium]
MERNTFMSKKVFFLYPHSVIQQGLVRELVANEYAVYLVSNHKRFREVLRDFDEPIVFINIDENLDPDQWREYISEIKSSDDNNAKIGVLTYNEDKDLAKTYLMDLGIQCGFIKLKLGLDQSRSIILKTLEANEAKGRRKYLRIDCWQLPNTELNMKFGDELCSGRIRDISSVGLAFMFDKERVLEKHTMLKDIQLKLRGKIARVSGPVIGERETPEGTIYVILFNQDTDSATRSRIHSFMYETLQEEINRIMLR